MTPDASERRRRSRLRLACPVVLCRPGQRFRTVTQTEDISCEGFFCFTKTPFSLNEQLECELTIPLPEQRPDAGSNMVLYCRAEVVRLVSDSDRSPVAIACHLSDYRIGRGACDPETIRECLDEAG